MYNIYKYIVLTLHAHVHTCFHTPHKYLLLLSWRIPVSKSENMTHVRDWHRKSSPLASTARVSFNAAQLAQSNLSVLLWFCGSLC